MSLLKRLQSLLNPVRTFALVDQQGVCRALRQSAQLPQGAQWVEIEEYSLSLLSRPLPLNARRRASQQADKHCAAVTARA
ncbi:hypothetical protein WG219_05375 [Ectopseudomonas mendocina]|uniref:Uncharacterized protein n=1 Tax=Ectopseudomonas mendocina TaxID=300 RepID=A0ABZ2RKH6_ECTME